MYRTNSSRVLPIIIMVIVTIALIVGMVIIGKRLFGGANTTQQSTQQSSAESDLLTIDDSHSVVMNMRGPLVANEDFRSYQITISPDTRSYVSYKGYDNVVLSQQNLGNLTSAYKEFVYALDHADFTKPGRQSGQSGADNTEGVCATGSLYTFTIDGNGSAVDSFWTSTCSGSPGTFGANLNQVGNLFASQIPGLNLGFSSNQFSL